MPEIITGRKHSERGLVFFERIKSAAQEGETLIIVPDQFSFEFDKLLYEYLGAVLFNSVRTYGISRLCEDICKTYGGRALENADENAKLIAMYKAQSKLRAKGKLRFYKKSLLRPVFVSSCISLIAQLVRAGATPETVQAAAECQANGSIKLFDIAAIFSAYNEALSQMGLREGNSETAQAAILAAENKYFQGKRVFFDAFASFSKDEMSLVKSALAGSKSTIFSLICDTVKDGTDPFALTIKTAGQIEQLAADCNLTVKRTHCGRLSQAEPLAHVNYSLWEHSPQRIDSQGLVKLVRAADIYEESEFVCAQICRLVREGLSYNDIAVICGGLSDNAQILGAVAQRYDIPYFVDEKSSALTSVPAKYLMSILDAALTRKYKTENILRIVKSPLSPILVYDACDLEDYCITWRVEGDMWKNPFMLEGRSDRIEKTKNEIIEPLEKFRNATQDATADEICHALFTLLDELQMSKQVYSTVKTASTKNDTELEVGRSFKQVWLGMIKAIRAIYENMKGEKISLRAFAELLRLMLDGIKISAPPQKSDCVRFADAQRSRISGVKVLFIMQANDGIFPQDIKADNLLGENEMQALADQGAELDGSARRMLDSERMNVYLAAAAPSQRLYLTYSESDRSGAACAPSSVCANLASLFSDDIFSRAAEYGQEFYCTSYHTAFYSYLAHCKDKTQQNANVREALRYSAEYNERLELVLAAAAANNESITQQTARELFFPGSINLSATRVSDYYKCPFMYFCKYGLRLSQPRAVDMDSRYIGNIAHACLERVMSREQDGKRVYNEKFTGMSEGELYEIIDKQAEEYIKNEMGGDYGKTLTFKYAVKRLKSSILSMAINFRDELAKSLFLPVAFEYKLSGEGGSALALQLNGVDINLYGTIDRADIYRTDSGTWLRIVDYKTGKQNFREEEVYHGLDLQMLIYLLAAAANSEQLASGESLRPAGIMYSHLCFVPPTLSVTDVEEAAQKGELERLIRLEHAKKYKPDGMSLADEIMPALNTDHEGVYTVFRLTKSGAVHSMSTVKPSSEQRLAAMQKFALQKVTEMAERLMQGDIRHDPIETASGLPCTYCDYKTMCAEPSPKDPRRVMKEDKKRLDEELQKITEEENRDGGKLD